MTTTVPQGSRARAPRRRARITRIEVALDALPQGVLLIDNNGRIAAANAMAERMFGFPRRGLHGRAVSECVPDIVAEDYRIAPGLDAPLPTPRTRPRRRELTAWRNDGSRFPLRLAFSTVKSDGSFFILASMTDLTTRRAIESKLEDRRDHFRQLAEALPRLLWTCLPDGSADYFGPQWVAYTGVAAEDQFGCGWIAQVHPVDRESLSTQWQSAVESGQVLQTQFRLRRHDGMYRWFDVQAVPLRSRDGSVGRWFGSAGDVHEAYEMRQQLLEERNLFAKVVASAPAAIFSYRLRPDGSTSLPFISPGFRELYGLDDQQSVPLDPEFAIQRIHPQDAQRILSTTEESAANLTPWHQEWRIRHPQKGEVWIEGRSVPTREPDGSTLWYGIIVDITERKRAEEDVRRAEARLHAAVEAGGIGTWIWERQRDRLLWDEAMLRMFDRTAEEIAAATSAKGYFFIHPEDRAAVTAGIDAAVRARSDVLHVEHRTNRKDGALQWVEMTGRIERDADGNVARMIGACVDITARKLAAETLRRSQKIEALGTLAGGIAHDFNNMLLAITGNARLAQADLPADHPLQRYLAEIEKASVRASSLVHRLLAFSREGESPHTAIQLRPAIEEALKLLRSTLPAMIDIRTRLASSVPAVEADPTRIHQVIMNLITNAAHAIGDEGGVVTVALDSVTIGKGALVPGSPGLPAELTPGSYARLTVIDTGCGIDAAALERIFDPFFTTRPVGQGTGLGLSVVHGIVRSHQGAIGVQSAPGCGSTFTIYLPVASATAAKAPDEPRAAPHGRGQRVMYVDDEDALVYLVTRILERLGYEVTGFTDPDKALQAFQSDPYRFDVIVTDLSMPGMSGFHLARAMRSTRADVPILLTSGYVRPQDRDTARALGLSDIILKPDTVEELGYALQRMFEKPRG